MIESKTEPLAAPAETQEAPKPKQPAQPLSSHKPRLPAGSLPTIVRNSPGKVMLYAAVGFFGLLALDFLGHVPRWLQESRGRRLQTAVNSVTPDSVLTRCGQPLEDVTTDLYPMISRRMTYNSPIAAKSGPGKVVLFFSRTAEENSAWLYSSMKDESGATTYATPEEQAAALPCLASTK